jgi:hypothetical protein
MPKRSRDRNQSAKLKEDSAAGEAEDSISAAMPRITPAKAAGTSGNVWSHEEIAAPAK